MAGLAREENTITSTTIFDFFKIGLPFHPKSYFVFSHLEIVFHLLIGDIQEVLAGPGVAEASRAQMYVVKTGQFIHLKSV
jgi:hypothetical protein